MRIFIVPLLVGLLYGQTTLAQTSPMPSRANHSAEVRAELDQIVMADDYSKIETVSHWQENEPTGRRKESAFGRWLSELFDGVDFTGLSHGLGVIGKTVALLFLALLVWGLYCTRKSWLPWLSAFYRPKAKHTAPIPIAINKESQIDWVNLPPAHELSDFIKSLLSKGLWLPALSALYRGTLRELGVRHQLPIDRHQTENECMWLLTRSQAGASEREYFEKLVKLWRVSAYGQKLPSHINGDMTELLALWASLYGGRHE